MAKNYNLGLQINADIYPYLLSTKLYEYPALSLPQICICKKGDIKNIVEENGLGTVLDPSENINVIIKKILHASQNYDINKLYNFALRSTWSERSKDFIKLIDTF